MTRAEIHDPDPDGNHTAQRDDETTTDRVDPEDRAHVEKVREWVQELARMHVEDGEELPTRLALAMIDTGKLVRIFDKYVPAPKEGSGT